MNRVWSKVDVLGEDDCWEWKAGGRGVGYGAIKYNGRTIDSHRMAWFITHGYFPDLLVCHSCDNRLCCNPNHLFLGTHQDNVDDMVKKGRQAIGETSGAKQHPESILRGEDNGQSKLTNFDVLEIRRLYKTGNYTERHLGKLYKTTCSNIHRIINRQAWKHIL